MVSNLSLKRLDHPRRLIWTMLTTGVIAALYSSTEGPGAGVSAVVALAIDVWVAIRFVPGIVTNLELKRPRTLTRRRFTREGRFFAATVALAGGGAIATGNDLLYMALAGLLAILLISAFISSQNFSRLGVSVFAPAQCFVGEPFPVSIRVHNGKRAFSNFALQMEGAGGGIGVPAVRFSVIGPQQKATQVAETVLRKRGRRMIRKVTASSSYPFGILLQQRDYDVDVECLCYPEIIPMERVNQFVPSSRSSNLQADREDGSELYAIRDYLPSDSSRRIHWKASAKTGALKSREYARERSRRIALHFDRFGCPSDAEQFEQLVSCAASLAYHLIRSGVEVALVSDDWQSAYGASEASLDSILRYLAMVTMSSTAASPRKPTASEVITLSLRPLFPKAGLV
jgi:uncharacterized protein (DUF58 family)